MPSVCGTSGPHDPFVCRQTPTRGICAYLILSLSPGKMALSLHVRGDCDAVPAVDENNGHNDLGQELLVEQLCSLVISRVGNVVADQRNFFCQGEDGALLGGEKLSIPPGVQGIQSLFGLSGLAGVARMHVDTKGTPVDLGSSRLD